MPFGAGQPGWVLEGLRDGAVFLIWKEERTVTPAEHRARSSVTAASRRKPYRETTFHVQVAWKGADGRWEGPPSQPVMGATVEKGTKAELKRIQREAIAWVERTPWLQESALDAARAVALSVLAEKRPSGAALAKARLAARQASRKRARMSKGGFMDPVQFAAALEGKVKIGGRYYKAGKEAIDAVRALLDAADSPRRKARLRQMLARQKRLTPAKVRASVRGKRPRKVDESLREADEDVDTLIELMSMKDELLAGTLSPREATRRARALGGDLDPLDRMWVETVLKAAAMMTAWEKLSRRRPKGLHLRGKRGQQYFVARSVRPDAPASRPWQLSYGDDVKRRDRPGKVFAMFGHDYHPSVRDAFVAAWEQDGGPLKVIDVAESSVELTLARLIAEGHLHEVSFAAAVPFELKDRQGFFSVGDTDYRVTLAGPTSWMREIVFEGRPQGGRWTMGLTGTGSPVKVLSTVVSVVRAYMKQHPGIGAFLFTAAGRGRARLYDRMMRMFAKRLGWVASSDTEEGRGTYSIAADERLLSKAKMRTKLMGFKRGVSMARHSKGRRRSPREKLRTKL